jgi:hypothetical protein
MGRNVARMEQMRNAYNIFFFFLENLKRRDHSEGPGVDGKDNIRIGLRETGSDVVDWIHLVQDRDQWRAFVKTVMNLRFP